MLITSRRSSVIWARALALALSMFTLYPLPSPASDYGTTGIIDLPSARMGSDGTLQLAAAFDGLHDSFMVTYQVTPWLEGTFRYTGFNDFFHWDRNYEIKAKLLDESYFLPQVSVGLRDVVGTGVFGSEYIVASKNMNEWDITLGLGWGRLAGSGDLKNPLTLLSKKYKNRPEATGDVEDAGEINPNYFFRGRSIGLFGGISYSPTNLPIKALLEFNPDSYAFNKLRGSYEPSSALSYGIQWQPFSDLTLTLSHQHGDEFGISIASRLNTKNKPKRSKPRQFKSSKDMAAEELPEGINKENWYDLLLYDIERSGLILVSAGLNSDQSEVELVVGNASYAIWPDALAGHISLSDLHLPESVKVLYFVIEDGGHRISKVKVDRPSANPDLTPAQLSRNIKILPSELKFPPGQSTDFYTGKINFTADINNRVQLFDPEDPARYQIYLDVGAEYTLNANWAIRSQYSVNLYNNFDESTRKPNSRLPSVRSDIVRYLSEGATGLDMLMLEGRGSISEKLHYRAFGGILEEMYAGAGGEILYWPYQSRIALGASIAAVQKRDFNKGLKLLDYRVATGFASLYWATPFYNFDSAIHLGRYLAKDAGATFELRRTFTNGWQLGVWATITNVSAEKFGEGSFDKGFYFRVPFSSLLGNNTRSAYTTRIRPVQRDGGQRLENHSGTLFWDLRQARFDVFTEDLRRLVP